MRWTPDTTNESLSKEGGLCDLCNEVNWAVENMPIDHADWLIDWWLILYALEGLSKTIIFSLPIAYDVLSDPDKRRRYDMTGSDSPQPHTFDYNSFYGQGGGNAHAFKFNFDDIFSNAFGDDDDSFFHSHGHHPHNGKGLWVQHIICVCIWGIMLHKPTSWCIQRTLVRPVLWLVI